MRKRNILLFLLVLTFVSVETFAQVKTGLLIGGGLGFEQGLKINKNYPPILKKGAYIDDNYQYDGLLGYRIRFENKEHQSLFFDVDPLVNLKVYESKDYYPKDEIPYGPPSWIKSHNVNFSFAISSSINYKIISGLYIGAGIEPTWNIITDGKTFDAPILGRIGFNANNKIDFALTYRQGLTNSLNDNRYTKGRVSDINISVFIPFTSK